MQRGGKAGINQSSNIVPGGVRSIVIQRSTQHIVRATDKS
jgi:hypothetical protein